MTGRQETAMDPNACLDRMSEAVACRDYHEAREAVRDLQSWIGRGGFLPRAWDDFTRAGAIGRCLALETRYSDRISAGLSAPTAREAR